MRTLWKSIIGPRLIRIYSMSQVDSHSINDDTSRYMPNTIEKFGNNILRGINVLWNIGIITSPLIVTYLYKREYICMLGILSLVKMASGIGMLIVMGMFIRGLGRSFNVPYITFLRCLENAQSEYSTTNKAALSRYDFEFWAWPRDFSVFDVEGEDKPLTQAASSTSRGNLGPIATLLSFPCYISSYLCIHLFGRHLIYPGSVHLLQYIISQALEVGREKLSKGHKGLRSKILTRDNNEIDTMFVDRRQSKVYSNGSTLVLCCEGNAGFYEVGLMGLPVDLGYSVLGWNHPGFSGSTGKPYPLQDQYAIDSVMQYAIHKLKFQPENILIYAWSIGGYSGSWAAMNYPQVRGIVLDATFDHVVHLAIPRMPSWMSGLVKTTIRDFMNLNTAEQLCKYPGPVTIIRRTKDEIITTVEGDIGTNRGNNLLTKLLHYRYPVLTSSAQAAATLAQWTSEDEKIQGAIFKKWEIDDQLCLAQLLSYMTEKGTAVPLSIGEDWNDDEKTKMILFIARKIFINFENSHNNPLDPDYFKIPWSPEAIL